LTRYLSHQMEKQRVRVLLNQEVDWVFVQAFIPEVIIVATGSFPAGLGDIGKMGNQLCYAHEVLGGEREIGRKVLVIGGGSVGTGTADFLAEKGCEVTLVLRRVDFGSKLEPSTKMVVQKRLRQNGVKIIPKAHFRGIADGKARIEREGKDEYLEADNVVLAVGSRPENSLYEEIKGKRENVYAIGDCVEPRGIFEAMAEAGRIARTI
jgi:2,4-dienoyl-CoA reductase (NADPH2)